MKVSLFKLLGLFATTHLLVAETVNFEGLLIARVNVNGGAPANQRQRFEVFENGNSVRTTHAWGGFILNEDFSIKTATANTVLSFDVKFGEGEERPEFVFIALHDHFRLQNSGPSVAVLHVGNDIESPTLPPTSQIALRSYFSNPDAMANESWYDEIGDGWYRYSIPIGLIGVREEKVFDRVVIGVSDTGVNPSDGQLGWAEFRSVRIYNDTGDGVFSFANVNEDLFLEGDIFLRGNIRDSNTGELLFDFRNQSFSLPEPQGDLSSGIYGTSQE